MIRTTLTALFAAVTLSLAAPTMAEAGPNKQTSKITIYNPTDDPIHYELSMGGSDFLSFTVKPGQTKVHSTNDASARFVIRFDHRFNRGYQNRRYNLDAGIDYSFWVNGNGLELGRR